MTAWPRNWQKMLMSPQSLALKMLAVKSLKCWIRSWQASGRSWAPVDFLGMSEDMSMKLNWSSRPWSWTRRWQKWRELFIKIYNDAPLNHSHPLTDTTVSSELHVPGKSGLKKEMNHQMAGLLMYATFRWDFKLDITITETWKMYLVMKDFGSVPIWLRTKQTTETVFLVENAPPSYESTKRIHGMSMTLARTSQIVPHREYNPWWVPLWNEMACSKSNVHDWSSQRSAPQLFWMKWTIRFDHGMESKWDIPCSPSKSHITPRKRDTR